jgi:hypothetical protein
LAAAVKKWFLRPLCLGKIAKKFFLGAQSSRRQDSTTFAVKVIFV